MGNELVVREMDFDTLQRQALALQASGYFKDGRDPLNKAQAITKVLAGAELGLPPFASMSGLHIIQGKPVLGSNLIATLVKNSGRYDYRVKQCDNEACIIEWFENGESVGEAGFTMEEAKAAQLTGKDNWRKYPSDMLFARAISRGARRFAPGVFGGAPVYSPDEMGADEDEGGNIVSVTGPEVDEETGEILDDEPTTAEWEDLQSASETPTNGNGTQPDPLQAARDSLTGKTSTLADIATAAVMTGLYDNQPHAWNTVKMYDWPESDKFELKAEQKVKTETAHEVLDWMIVRKLDEEDSERESAAA